jgi:hypothetical protein
LTRASTGSVATDLRVAGPDRHKSKVGQNLTFVEMEQCTASRVSHRRDARQRNATPCSPMETSWEQVALQQRWMDTYGGWSRDFSIGGASRLRCRLGAARHTRFKRALRHQPQPDVGLDLALCWRSAHHAKRVDGCIGSSSGRAHSPGRSSRRTYAGGDVRRSVRHVPEAGSSIPLAADVQRQLPGTQCMRASEKTPSTRLGE